MANAFTEAKSVTDVIKTPKKWSALRVIGTLIAVAFAALLLLVGWQYWLFKGGVFKTSTFNQQEWLLLGSAADDLSCYRGGMAHDIKTNILRAGQTSDEVENILGKPDSIKDSVYVYGLGMCSGLRIDFDSLDVHFNTKSHVERVNIVQH